MRVKLDENLGTAVLGRSGRPDAVATVPEHEHVRYRPSHYAGIIVLRPPEPLHPADFDGALQRLAALASTRSPNREALVIDDRRIREFAEEDPLGGKLLPCEGLASSCGVDRSTVLRALVAVRRNDGTRAHNPTAEPDDGALHPPE